MKRFGILLTFVFVATLVFAVTADAHHRCGHKGVVCEEPPPTTDPPETTNPPETSISSWVDHDSTEPIDEDGDGDDRTNVNYTVQNADGAEYSYDGGAWTTATASPQVINVLADGQEHTVEMRAKRSSDGAVDETPAAATLTMCPQAGCSTSPPPPPTGGSVAVGSHFHALWPVYDDAQRTAVFDKLAAAGVNWVRIDLSWYFTEQYGDNQYNTSTVDKLHRTLDMAEARGINVLLNVWETPAWANGNAGGNVPPSDNAYWADFAKFLTAEYGTKVDAYEQWNEPNEFNDQFWTGTAAQYTELVKAGYPAFKAGDSSAPVLAGSTSYADDAWMREMYAAGAKGYFDAFAVHPYMAPRELEPEVDNGKWSLKGVDTMRDTMLANGDDKPIWYTEYGWSSCEEEAPSNDDCVTDAQQGDYLTRALDYIRANQPYVTHTFWYTERDRSTSNDREANFGLLRQNNTEKPSYTAIKAYPK